jgi:plasmid maintenance system killer protein
MEERNAQRVSPLKRIGLHPRKGNRRGQWAITVNGPWRICYRFKDGNAYEVEIVDDFTEEQQWFRSTPAVS